MPTLYSSIDQKRDESGVKTSSMRNKFPSLSSPNSNFVSAMIMQLFKKGIVKDINGNKIVPKQKKKGVIRTLVGGTFFGLGWGVSGACAAPVFVILGFKWLPALIILLGALIGAFIYGILSNKLPN